MQEMIASLQQQMRVNAQAAMSGATQQDAALALARSKQAEVSLPSIRTVRTVSIPASPAALGCPRLTRQIFTVHQRSAECTLPQPAHARSQCCAVPLPLLCHMPPSALAVVHDITEGILDSPGKACNAALS